MKIGFRLWFRSGSHNTSTLHWVVDTRGKESSRLSGSITLYSPHHCRTSTDLTVARSSLPLLFLSSSLGETVTNRTAGSECECVVVSKRKYKVIPCYQYSYTISLSFSVTKLVEFRRLPVAVIAPLSWNHDSGIVGVADHEKVRGFYMCSLWDSTISTEDLSEYL